MKKVLVKEAFNRFADEVLQNSYYSKYFTYGFPVLHDALELPEYVNNKEELKQCFRKAFKFLGNLKERGVIK